MSRPPDHTPAPHDDLERLHARAAELERDIAQHHSNTGSLAQAADQHYRLLFEYTPSMYFALLPDGTVLSVNQYGAQYLGYTPEELTGRSILNVFARADHATILSQLATCSNNPSRTFEWEIGKVRKDGGLLWVKERAQTVGDGRGRLMILVVCEDITAEHHSETLRKQAEQELQMTKERLQHLITSSPAVVYAGKPCGDFGTTYISDNVLDQTGYPSREFLDNSNFWGEHIHPDDRARVFAEMANLFRDGHLESDYRFRHKDGTYRWMHDRLRVVCDEAGNPTEIVGSWIDVTERKQAEEALRTSEERLRLTQYAVDHAADYIFLIGRDGYFVDANDSACRRLGYTKEELLRMSVMDIDPDFPPSVWESFWTEIKKTRRVQLETRHRSKSGEIYPVEVTANYIQHDGRELDYAIVRDITERKQAEEALRKSHTYLRQVIDVDPNFIFAKDRDGRFTLVNQAVADAYGTSVDELIGKTDADFNSNQSEVEFFRKMDLEVMNTGRERFIPEEAITDAQGRTRWLQTVKRPIFDEHGEAIQVLGSSTDMTERKKAEEQRERLSRDLHDNLLQSLYAVGMQLEAGRLAGDASGKQWKAYAGRAIDQLNRLVQDVRSFIALLKHRTVPGQDLGQALRHLVTSLSFTERSTPQFEIQDAAVAALTSDQADHLLNIAREALSNSLRHARARRRWILLRRTASDVLLEIGDDGIGFDAGQDPRRGHHGLGHIADRAKQIGARLQIASAPRQGTSVKVELTIAGGVDHA